MAALLSQYNFIGNTNNFFSSSIIFLSQIISQIPWAIDRYSASALLELLHSAFYSSKSRDFPR
uniref:Putative ovule protein n=1 Tax=Solanum chacoense TaxID=4108 RepID=A0A0V0IBY3_SOLCH